MQATEHLWFLDLLCIKIDLLETYQWIVFVFLQNNVKNASHTAEGTCTDADTEAAHFWWCDFDRCKKISNWRFEDFDGKQWSGWRFYLLYHKCVLYVWAYIIFRLKSNNACKSRIQPVGNCTVTQGFWNK